MPATNEPKTEPLNYSAALEVRANRARNIRSLIETAGMALVLLVMTAVLSLYVPYFFSGTNAKALFLAVSTVGMIACTMLFCLAAGDFDLSVGSTVAMAGVLAAVVSNKLNVVVPDWLTHHFTSMTPANVHSVGMSIAIAGGVVAAIVAGAIVGFINGFVIAQLGINALITTLATMQIVRGVAFLICDGKPVGIQAEGFWQMGIGYFLGLPAPIWFMLTCFLVFGVLLNSTVFGRNSLAIGGNLEASRLAGVAVVRTKIVIFTLQGAVAAMAGVVLAARQTSGQPAAGQGLELQVISACVLGGVSLTGGVGTMLGVVVGVLIMGEVNNSLNLLNIPTFYQYIASGSVLLAAVLFDRLKQRWL